MPLLKSISGIRGLIGGRPGENLTPPDIISFTAAFVSFLKKSCSEAKPKVIIGRDGRPSGEMVRDLVSGALMAQGVNVIDLGLASTPTIEMAVIEQKAQGGIIISASHNQQGWNALKLIDAQGEFFSAREGNDILSLVGQELDFPREDEIGTFVLNPFLGQEHLRRILALPLVDVAAIKANNFKIVVDGINSVGGLAVPDLLKKLGVENIIELNCEPNGLFAHKPEPLAENLSQVMDKVRQEKADLGIVVDPDVDRLAFIMENGEMMSEEYSLVAIADYVLANFDAIDREKPGRYQKMAISNLSSSRALKDIAEKHKGGYEAAAVGEVNVVTRMKETKAVIGGEGNGGIVFPELHYGRDALVGIALFLTYLAKKGKTVSELKAELPAYHMVKDRIDMQPGLDLLAIMEKIREEYKECGLTTIDGLRIDWDDSWVHLRASNTEPIIRVYAEASDQTAAIAKVKEMKDKILAYIK